jgi:hypothetical protein
MTDDELDQRVRAAVLSEQIDTARLEASIRERLRRPILPRWALAAAASIALAIAGGLTYRTFFRAQTPPICVAAAQDHNHEITNGQPREWLSSLSAIQSLAVQQGVPAAAVSALGTTGYRLERGRLCFLKKQIFLHLVYTKDDTELSFYLRPHGSESPFDGSVRQASVDSEDLAYFQTDRLTAVFVAEQSTEALVFARAAVRVL